MVIILYRYNMWVQPQYTLQNAVGVGTDGVFRCSPIAWQPVTKRKFVVQYLQGFTTKTSSKMHLNIHSAITTSLLLKLLKIKRHISR